VKDNKDILKEYVCEIPFMYTDVHENGQYLCCPSWSPLNIKTNLNGESNYKIFDKTDDVMRNWISDNSYKIRKGVYDGTYSQCNHTICPKLNQLIGGRGVPREFLKKEDFQKKYEINTIEDVENFKNPPEEILFGFDRSCNLKCPSCRISMIANDREGSIEYENKFHLLKSIEDNFGSNLRKILVTGSGDPFYSNLYRKYLQNFDKSKYPNLNEIQIITNGIMLNKKMWESLSSAPYIKYIEVSIDAATKNTYENLTRLNGRWDVLIDNLKFLSTLETVDSIALSMVVSKNNYKEMHKFYTVFSKIFKNFKGTLNLHYRQIVDWNTYSKEQLKELQIFNQDHELYSDFMIELNKIHGLKVLNKSLVDHNFHHLYSNKII